MLVKEGTPGMVIITITQCSQGVCIIIICLTGGTSAEGGDSLAR